MVKEKLKKFEEAMKHTEKAKSKIRDNMKSNYDPKPSMQNSS